jgi:hypothetical protein
MTAFNFIKFEWKCKTCSDSCVYVLQSSTCATFEGALGSERFFDNVYRVGDRMKWKTDDYTKDEWESEYSYVSKMSEYNKSIIEPCYGSCEKCGNNIVAYVLFTNMKIIRIIGVEEPGLGIL